MRQARHQIAALVCSFTQKIFSGRIHETDRHILRPKLVGRIDLKNLRTGIGDGAACKSAIGLAGYLVMHDFVGERALELRKVAADVAGTRRAEHGVRNRVTHGVGVRMTRQPAVERDRHAAQYERTSLYEPMQIVSDAGAAGPRWCRSAEAFALR